MVVTRQHMDIVLYISGALWVAGWGFIVYFYFAPCRCGLHLGRSTKLRQAFFDLAAAFFFVPIALAVLIRHRLKEHAEQE